MGIISVLLLCVFHCLSADEQILGSLPAEFLLIPDMYSGSIYRLDINNYSCVDIPFQEETILYDIDYDPSAAVIYTAKANRIISLSIYGDKKTTLLAFNDEANIVGIAVDSISRLLFYTDEGNYVIGVIGLENNSHKTVIKNMQHLGDLVADAINGKIYWSESEMFVQILKVSNYDGTNRKQVMQIRNEIADFYPVTTFMDVDLNGGDLYWCDAKNKSIWRVNESGSNVQHIFESQEDELRICSIAVYQSYIYFTFGSVIKRIGTDGTGETVIPCGDLGNTYAIHVHSNRSRANNGCSSGLGRCSHYCFPLPGGSTMCSCPDFMTLMPDGKTCQSSSFLLITTNDKPHIYGVVPSNGQGIELPLQSYGKPHAISYDPINRTIFWTETTLPMICSASISGNNERVVRYLKHKSSPQGIAVDATSRLLFYTDKENGIIAALSLDGSSEKVVIRNKFDEPGDIVTNPINGTIFWTNLGNNGKIETANYDGTNRQELINTGLVEPSGLAIDIKEGVLYWCVPDGIHKANVNGLNHQIYYKENNEVFYRIAFYQSYLYYTSASQRNVMKIGRNERKPTLFGPTTAGKIVDLHFFTGAEILDINGCSNARDTCSHFCFPRPGGLKVCACPDGMSLESEGQTCQASVTSLPTDNTMNTQSDRLPSSFEIDGSSVGLTVLRAAVGSLASLLVVSILLNACLIRKRRRMQKENKISELYTTLIRREEENAENRTV
ncbi:hypothetical protein CHS0354_011759 [Potamilus streckersoni]|uniref:EGF-like domain-containing protein n=1 Tax=Potamilus streckersoni TaxID=2493646 RepID=A0AAE0SQ12_9BIVA|nr:hypothetical protein CHS0354_011759 [Potamilus streckersoni]